MFVLIYIINLMLTAPDAESCYNHSQTNLNLDTKVSELKHRIWNQEIKSIIHYITNIHHSHVRNKIRMFWSNNQDNTLEFIALAHG